MHVLVLFDHLSLEMSDVLLLHLHMFLNQPLVLLVFLKHERKKILLTLLRLGQLILIVSHYLTEIDCRHPKRLWRL